MFYILSFYVLYTFFVCFIKS